jgi:hypothetical protein
VGLAEPDELANMHTSNERLVAFLPWLKLREAVAVGDAVRFVPFVPGNVHAGDELRDLAAPLAAKTILREEGHYALTRTDEVCCCALDLILAKAGWDNDNGTNQTVWQAAVNEAKRKSRVAKAVRALEQKHSAQ